MASAAGIVLAGGLSSRMGTPKARLDWHGSTLLRRVTGIVDRVVDGPLVVVRARGQDLPPLPRHLEVVDDDRDARGPLQGVASGLAAVAGRSGAAFVTSTDAPLLHPRLIELMLEALAGHEIAVATVDGRDHPLSAAYATSAAAAAERLLLAGESRLTRILEHADVRRVSPESLLADPVLGRFDPALRSLTNVNDPAAYEAALAAPLPLVRVRVEGAGARREVQLRAATLGAAAAAAGAQLDAGADPEWPLVAGDAVTLVG